nr:retrovirus-related Pol polyprotein from transposon TNT 1-94 [Tanacetum cinerariifolium]
MSSAKAEYVVAARCYAQVLWIKSQLADYDILYDKVPIFCDNTSVTAISNNPMLHSRTKYIDIGYHFIRDHILKGDIKLHFLPTDLQLADIFTKPLAEPSFTRLVAELGMYVEYLKDFWYTAEVDDATKDVSFSLSHFENQLIFTRFDFLSTIRLTDSKTVMPLPPKGTIRAGLATLGLTNKYKPSLTSTELINSSPLKLKEIIFNDLIQKLQNGKKNRETNVCYTRYISLVLEQLLGDNYHDASLTVLEPYQILATSFQTPSASKVSLTSHMLKVAKLLKDPEESLILPSEGVNAEESADKSISTSSPPTTHLQHAEEFVVLDQIVEEKEIAKEHPLVIPSDEVSESPYDTESEIKFIKSFKAYTISDYVVSSSKLSFMPDDDLHSTSPFDTIKSGDDDDNVDMADSEHISKEGTTDTLLNVIAEFHSLSRHLDHVYEEVSNLHSKIADIESLILHSISDELNNFVPTLISNALKDQLLKLLFKALKECRPSILRDSLPSQLHQTTKHETKNAKMMEEYNHQISFRADALPITKITYVINSKKEATMKITRGDNPLNLIVHPDFRLKQLGFRKRLGLTLPPELATFGLTDKEKKRKRSEFIKEMFVTEDIRVDGMNRNMIPSLGIVSIQGKRLGLTLPPELATFGLTDEEKKRKRTEFIKEMFVTEDIRVDGMNRNMIPSLGIVSIQGVFINEPKSGIFFMNGNTDMGFQRESEFHLTPTVELIRLQNQIKVDLEISKEMVSRMNYVIEARSDCLKAREIIEMNLDNFG